jgi:hypothetical protein
MTDPTELDQTSYILTIDTEEGGEHEIELQYAGSSALRTSFCVRGQDLTTAPFFTLTKNHSFWLDIFNSNGGEKRYSLSPNERQRFRDLYLNRCVGRYAGLHFTPARRGPVLIKADYGY